MKKGTNVTTLKREDFAVYEDETEQEISNFFPVEAPFHLVLALDNSSSTRTSLNLIKNAALNFVNELRPEDQIALTEINFFVRELQNFTNNRKTLAKALQQSRFVSLWRIENLRWHCAWTEAVAPRANWTQSNCYPE